MAWLNKYMSDHRGGSILHKDWDCTIWQRIITYHQLLRWEATLPRWTHAGRYSGGSASWCLSRSQSFEMFLRAHPYLVIKTEKCWSWCWRYQACCFLFLLPARSLTTSPLRGSECTRGEQRSMGLLLCKCCRCDAVKHLSLKGSQNVRCSTSDDTAT